MNYLDNDNPDRVMLSVGVRVLIVVLLVLAIGGAITYAWAPWKGQIEERNQTVGSGTYRIATYEWYYDQCSAIQSAEQIIATYKAQLNATPPPSPDQAVRDQAAITGNTQTWITDVNQYNANARKEKTQGQFKDDSLPAYINPSNLQNGVPTTCGS